MKEGTETLDRMAQLHFNWQWDVLTVAELHDTGVGTTKLLVAAVCS
jgi:hypothetical protein